MNNEAWSRIYSAASRGFDDPSPDLVARASNNLLLLSLATALNNGHQSLLAPFDQLWDEIRRLRAGTSSGLGELQVEHTRLFYGPPCPLVSPYEHAYREGGVAADATKLKETYRCCGLAPACGFKDLADHVCLELELMAHLLAKGDAVAANRFHSGHLAEFLPRFAAAVREHTTSPFYIALAGALDALANLQETPEQHPEEATR
ncbi:MAG: TorD/DmsD family molecular chaperone [Planctomycetota bacterium]